MTSLKTLRQSLLIIRRLLSASDYNYNMYNKKLSLKTIKESSESSINTCKKVLQLQQTQKMMQVHYTDYNVELQQTLHLSLFNTL